MTSAQSVPRIPAMTNSAPLFSLSVEADGSVHLAPGNGPDMPTAEELDLMGDAFAAVSALVKRERS